jgi:hypothetical protein
MLDREKKRNSDRLRRANRTKEQWLKEALRKANGRGLEFDLVEAEFWELPTHCPIFPEIELNYSCSPRTEATASLERIDNSKGYVRDNVIICSWKANNLKRDVTTKELKTLAVFYSHGNTANTVLHVWV